MQEVSAGYAHGRMPGTSATGCGEGCLNAVCLWWAGLRTSRFALGTVRVQAGAGGDLGEGSSLLIAVALLTRAHAATLGLEGCQRVLEAELQEEPSGSL